jgi:hypothetical protein
MVKKIAVAERIAFRAPPVQRLRTLTDIRKEMARVYRNMREFPWYAETGTKLIWVLRQLADLIDGEQAEIDRAQRLTRDTTSLPHTAEMVRREIERVGRLPLNEARLATRKPLG